ncbi:MAG TPA: biotin/lipoyl-containing protein [Gemmatimonadales bacterium]|nr:biotin/lipoyl-containing protein [Gemmatimonadales bacterium]
MKYFVTIEGKEVVVELDGERLTVDGRTVASAHLQALPGTPIRHLLLDGASYALAVEPGGRGEWRVARHGERFEAEVVDERTRHIRSLTGAGQKAHGPAALKAPMPGLVVRVAVAPGERVAAGAPVVVLEAMTMENELRAPAAAVVQGVKVKAGEAVEKGQVLVEFEVGA